MWWAVWTAAAGAVLLILYRNSHRLGRKLVILTGADHGMGYEMARELATRGARVVLAGEHEERGAAAAARLRSATGADVQYRHLDLSSLCSVRAFAASFVDNERSIDILINNASVSQLDNSLTEDGIVVEMQINYFGPFLLTNLLLPLLKNASQGRIVNGTSVKHYLGNINLSMIGEKARDSHAHKRALATSELCHILFTSELARRLQGTRVTANCFHPGDLDNEQCSPPLTILMSTILTTYLDNSQVAPQSSLLLPLCNLLRFFNLPCGNGDILNSVYVATSPRLSRVSGKYFVDCKETLPSKAARDEGLANKLWTVSEKLVKLKDT